MSFHHSPIIRIRCCVIHHKKHIKLISDLDTYTLFESSIRGGYVSAVKNHVELNNKNLATFDPSKPITSAAILDVNSLYPTTMVNKLPYGELEELSETEIEGFDIMSTKADGDYAYALLVDYTIPDETKLKTDELPLSIHKMTGVQFCTPHRGGHLPLWPGNHKAPDRGGQMCNPFPGRTSGPAALFHLAAWLRPLSLFLSSPLFRFFRVVPTFAD